MRGEKYRTEKGEGRTEKGEISRFSRLASHFFIFIILYFSLLLSPFSISVISAQNDAAGRIKSRLTEYFQNYRNDAYTSADVIRLTNVEVDTQQRTVSLYVTAGFASQPFTPETVQRIHEEVGRLMPEPYKAYQTIIYANGAPIEELVPLAQGDTVLQRRRWGEVEYRGYPWVTPASLPYTIMRGL